MQPLLVYGLQRSGTNYLEQLLQRNFEIELKNDGFARSLPIHKHFRLYDDMNFVPEPKYLNNFHYPSFQDFEAHVQKLTNVSGSKYLFISKEPFSWYLSVCKEARKSNWPNFMKKWVNNHFMVDYSLFHQKWLAFRREAPDKILHLRYEDLLNNFENTVNTIKEHFQLPQLDETFQNPSKVPKSKKFNSGKKEYYQQKAYMKHFSQEEIFVLKENLDEEVVKELGYELTEGK